MDADLENALDRAAESYPYPIAAACAKVRDTEPRDDWHEWELLSRDLLTPVLTYLSHLLLSDLVATGREPAHLFHRIESVLSRPLAGHYVGFLRETAKYYREEEVETAVPELVDFLLAAEIDETLTDAERPLLGELVDSRNRWAHGRIENEEVVENSLREIRRLTGRLLTELGFLTDAPLTLEDGTVLMGPEPDLPEEPRPLVTVTAEGVSLRPLLLKLEGRELSVLAEADLRDRRLTYRSPNSFTQFSGEDIDEDGEAAQLFEELKSLLREVRSLEAELPTQDLGSFRERAAVQTDRMLSLYGKSDLGKYDPDLYIPRPEWEGEDGRFWDFLEADETLLAIDGEQGTGKSALASRLAELSEERGHAVWFLNAQRFTFADVSWSGTPYPRYFADRLNYEAPFDSSAVERLVAETGEDERIVLFIDGINEIDAISNKWNRFKAISLLLEWVEAVAHPKLKVMLTFRTEAYRRFDYLEPEDLPDRVEEFSFLSGPSRQGKFDHPWVHTLDPFTESQARALYERLQGLQRGMAPDMSWDQVKNGLGEDLETFITNPLLFTIFLKAHDGRAEVLSTERDELFEYYVNGVTGARQRQAWPWWKRTYHFLKNGNITEKERFLADCVKKASESGTPSFLASDLAPGESDRDERIQQMLADPDKEDQLEQLQEAGLVVKEAIREPDDVTGTDSRLSFTSELLTKATDRMGRAVRNRVKALNSTLLTFYFLLALSVVVGLMYVILRYKMTGALWPAEGTSPSPLVPALGALMTDLVVHASPLILILLACVAYLNLPGVSNLVTSGTLGLVEYSLYRQLEDESLQVVSAVAQIVLPGFALTIVFNVFATFVFESEATIPLFYSAGLALFFLVLCAVPYLTNYFIRGLFDHPGRVKHRLLRNISSSVRDLSHRVPRLSTAVFILVVASALVLSYNLVDVYRLTSTMSGFTSIQDVWASQAAYQAFARAIPAYDAWFSIFLPVSVFMVLLVLCTPYLSLQYDQRRHRVYRDFLGRQTYSYRLLHAIVLPAYGGLVLLGASGWIPQSSLGDLFSQEDPKNVVAHHPALKPHVDTSRSGLRSATLHDASLSLNDLQALRSVPLKTLTLSSSQLRRIRLSEWNRVVSLVIVGDSVTLRKNDAMARLAALDVRGHLTGLSRVEDMYPLLSTLSVTEASVREAGRLPALWDEAYVQIRSSGPPDLGWLRPRSSSYIFGFSHPLSPNTKNLSLLRHVSAPGPTFDHNVLKKMHNLSWLYLTNSPCSEEESSSARRDQCSGLEHFETNRRVSIFHSENEKTLFQKRVSFLSSSILDATGTDQD